MFNNNWNDDRNKVYNILFSKIIKGKYNKM